MCLPPMLSIARCSLNEPPRGTSLFYFILFILLICAALLDDLCASDCIADAQGSCIVSLARARHPGERWNARMIPAPRFPRASN